MLRLTQSSRDTQKNKLLYKKQRFSILMKRDNYNHWQAILIIENFIVQLRYEALFGNIC